VLVKPIEAETKTASGIYLPDTAKEKPVRGEVVAVGPGKRLDNGKRAEMSVEKGDTVVYGKYAGTEVEIKEEFTIQQTADVQRRRPPRDEEGR
jgi:chaperonin GroES